MTTALHVFKTSSCHHHHHHLHHLLMQQYPGGFDILVLACQTVVEKWTLNEC